MKATVLIVDDEPDAVEMVAYNLKQAGYTVISAQNGAEALDKVRNAAPHLILLDVMLPELDGMELCKIFRNTPATAAIPIVMLTAKAAEIDRVLGLELGADDYVTKPFSPRELLLRIKKLLERPAAPGGREEYRFGVLIVDVPRHAVTVKGKPIELTATEFKLLIELIQSKGVVKTREHLLKAVWDYSKFVDTRTVDTHMRRLRQKLGTAADYLETIRGVGYRFVSE
jgi:two-component system phosphate regulon response regulator PhoB